MIELAENRYGKSRVRLIKVTRGPEGNDLREWTVQVLLTGDFEVVPGRAQESWVPTESTLDEVEMQAKQFTEFALNLPPNAAKGSPSMPSRRQTSDDSWDMSHLLHIAKGIVYLTHTS